MLSRESVSNYLLQIFEAVEPGHAVMQRVIVWEDIARRLTRIAAKNPPWGWRYVQSVATGSVMPSRKFAHAVELLGQQLDGTPVQIADTEQVTVYARTGQVQENSLIMGISKKCAVPTCLTTFVPVVPWQIYCPRHNKRKGKS